MHVPNSSTLTILIVGIEIVATCWGIFADLHMMQLLKKMKKGAIWLPTLLSVLSINKGVFFQKEWFVFQISKFPKQKYSKLLTWAWNLNLYFTVIGGKFKFKFQVQDSDLEYYFSEIWRFEKHIPLSEKATFKDPWGWVVPLTVENLTTKPKGPNSLSFFKLEIPFFGRFYLKILLISCQFEKQLWFCLIGGF